MSLNAALMWIGFFTFGSVLTAFAYILGIRQKGVNYLQLALSGSRNILEEVESVAIGQRFTTRFLEALARLGARLALSKNRGDIAEKLLHAGLEDKLRPEQFMALKLVAAGIVAVVVGGLLTASAGISGLLMSIAFGAGAYLAPDFWLSGAISKRQKEIERDLLGFSDTLALATEAGLPLTMAIRRVSEYYPGEMARGFLRAIEEINLGRPEKEVLLEFGERMGSEELKTLTAAIAQAQELGVSISSVLRGQAEQIRKLRQLKAQEIAQKASIKLLGPVIVFMFLPLLVLLMGPAVINLGKSLVM